MILQTNAQGNLLLSRKSAHVGLLLEDVVELFARRVAGQRLLDQEAQHLPATPTENHGVNH